MKLSATRFLASLLVVGLLIVPGSRGGAQNAATGGLSSLLTLPGEEALVRYAPGSLDRAARLHTRMTLLARQFQKWMPRNERDRLRLAAYVLGPGEWQAQELAFPYGVPMRVGPWVVATPAWGTEGSVATWKELLGPAMVPGADFAVRGTPEELSSLALADAFTQLELCRMFVEQQRLAGSAAEPWVADVLAHLLSRTADASTGVSLDLGYTLLSSQAASGAPEPGALAGYGGELELEAWLWFQGRFAAAAQEVWSAGGKGAVKKVLKARRAKGAPLSFADLAVLYPALGSWRTSAFPQG